MEYQTFVLPIEGPIVAHESNIVVSSNQIFKFMSIEKNYFQNLVQNKIDGFMSWSKQNCVFDKLYIIKRMNVSKIIEERKTCLASVTCVVKTIKM